MAKSFFPTSGRGTMKPADSFDAEAAAKRLSKAFKGLGSDEKTIIDVLSSHDSAQRQEIATKYKALFGQELIKDLDKELSGDFNHLCQALVQKPGLYALQSIHETVKDGCEHHIIGFVTNLTNDQTKLLRDSYKAQYGKELEHDITKNFSGIFRRLLVSLLSGGRDESADVDDAKAQEDAKALKEAGAGAGTDEQVFSSILSTRSYPQLKATFEAFEKVAGHSFEKEIKKEFSDDLKDALLGIVRGVSSIPAFYADRLHDAIEGAGTDDKILIRVIVCRSEVDLEDIKDEYKKLYKHDLVEDVKNDASGDYGKLLLNILNGNGGAAKAAKK